ncbi:hypothetical protein [Clostridium perfringens]|uniref:Uncharacterized protein n=2 Tax=root TaxID=1 RepID=A0AAN5SFD5_CLOPF|nr:hypothetical protein [Clostridium perfringens]DAF64453.1 MAG TPA: hypothetical protein [Siphoviridae sp. cttaA39]AQW26804.1 hypothetical protein BXT94_08500 [Clostridium perfringens]KAB8120561.1 hypothetical protein FVB38_05690 [Clostridium perfringens]KQC91164.1 hypothetical protein AM596_16015 [Clostridium perfringens CP4]MBI6053016.1 hypothetical protein [Clostridium perfringens]
MDECNIIDKYCGRWLNKKEQKELFIKLGYRNVRKLCMDLCYIVSYSRLSFDDDFRLMWIER